MYKFVVALELCFCAGHGLCEIHAVSTLAFGAHRLVAQLRIALGWKPCYATED